MEQELLKIFDDNKKEVGVASRNEVHQIGYWHEVFHCWFVGRENDISYIYLQLRSPVKKDYPGLYDITAAGHLLADENVEDGVREIEEELGVKVNFRELVSLGVIDYIVTRESFIDKEIANVFLFKTNNRLEDFHLQKEEVAGMVKAKFSDFEALWKGKINQIKLSGFFVNEMGEKHLMEETVGKNRFVPHQEIFYQTVIEKIKDQL
ncbi:Isopentenyldiphosphate isomerase [Gracilibacillus ureilyticus]|uniref:Isopentenyldiphosphate isomerase n=1 Tax=Gracilibacillus ureilyticus TaxID=531814 RepID=A0A1H9UH53_9BACI|nr:NUDIX domain-containing protein [Gracilibacillus ureilyticus]SES08756.1 Isopentenyldiphosphate isomerase [Gracilibacillus ureilyticus]